MKFIHARSALLLSLLLLFGGTGGAQAQAVPAPGRAQEPSQPQRQFQNTNYWQLGYAVNAPSQLLGLNTAFFGPALAGWGLYLDVKSTTENREDDPSFEPGLTPTEVEQQNPEHNILRFESEWRSVNGAVVRTLTEGLAVYAGAGYSQEQVFWQYFDPARVAGDFGFYWVENAEESGGRLNLLGGLIIRGGAGLTFHFGGESRPQGFTAGLSLALPFFR